MSTCTVCLAALDKSEGGLQACRACADELRGMLHETELQLRLLAGCRENDRGPAVRGGVGRAHAPMPGRVDVLDILGPGNATVTRNLDGDQTGGLPIGTWLAAWASAVAASYPAVGRTANGQVLRVGTDALVVGACTARTRGPATAGAWARWLQAYVPYIAGQPYVAAMHEELGDLVDRARDITGTIPRRRWKLAPCPACEERTLLEVDGRWFIRCQNCPRMMTRDQYLTYQRAYAADRVHADSYAREMLDTEAAADVGRTPLGAADATTYRSYGTYGTAQAPGGDDTTDTQPGVALAPGVGYGDE